MYSNISAYVLMVTTGNPNVLPNGSVFIPMTAPTIYRSNPTVSVPAYDSHNRCGSCGHPASEHPVLTTSAWESNCLISTEQIASAHAYAGDPTDRKPSTVFEHTDRYGLPLVDYAGPGTTEDMNDLDQWDYEEDSTLENYHDQHSVMVMVNGKQVSVPTEYTSLMPGSNESVKTDLDPKGKSQNRDETRNVYIEDANGITVKAYDDNLTRLYQARLLNVFTDKENRLAIGGMRFRRNSDSSVTAYCVQGYCKGFITLQLNGVPEEEQRPLMETFITNVIRHGNNHAAKWFVTRQTDLTEKVGYDSTSFEYEYGEYDHVLEQRPVTGVIKTETKAVVTTATQSNGTFYKVHAADCNITECGSANEPCNHNGKVTVNMQKALRHMDSNELFMFLIEHEEHCTDSNCQHDQWIKYLVLNYDNNTIRKELVA